MTRPKAVIFDLDGTLIDSAPAIAGIGNRCLAEIGLPPMSVEEARGYVGSGARVFLTRALTARDASFDEVVYARFREIYAADDGTANTPFPGVEAALSELRAQGIALGICTNKPMRPTATVLDVLGWRESFGAVVAGDTLEVMKPDPAPLLHTAGMLGAELSEIVYVGDSDVDAATAERCAARFLLFTEGYCHAPRETLYQTAVFSRYEAFGETLERALAA